MFSYIELCSGIFLQVVVTEIDRRLLSIIYTIKWAVNKTNPIQPRVVMKIKSLSSFSENIETGMFDEKFVFILRSLTGWFLDRLVSWVVVIPFQVST